MSCRHEKPRRVAPTVEWCPACGAYRCAQAWQLPELARDVPDMGALTSAVLAIEEAIAMARDEASRCEVSAAAPDDRPYAARAAAEHDAADRLERVATWLSNLPG